MGRRKKPLHHLERLDAAKLEVPKSSPEIREEEVAALAASLASRGQQEPILVTEGAVPGTWRVVVGRRRVLAARRLNWSAVDAIILPGTYPAELRVIERLQEDHYEPFALADTLQRLKDQCDWTQAHLGYAIGKTRDFVANILAITQIDPAVRRYIVDNSNGHALTARHLRYVARAEPAEQLAMARQIIRDRLSTKKLEQAKHSETQRHPVSEFIRVRELRRAGTAQAPRTAKEWRRYFRQLTTDLRRVDRQEERESRRALDLLASARLRRGQIKREADRKRRALAREIRQARRHLDHAGMMTG
jgi:ParB/RepB/Spo0J family partition protein